MIQNAKLVLVHTRNSCITTLALVWNFIRSHQFVASYSKRGLQFEGIRRYLLEEKSEEICLGYCTARAASEKESVWS